MPIRIKLNWTDPNAAESGHKIYRSESPMDPENLPSPLAVIGANITEHIDESVVEDMTYFYRVSAYTPYKEEVSAEVSAVASVAVRPQPFAAAHTTAQSASVSLNLPTGWAAGDLAVMIINSDSATNPLPSGWTSGVLVTRGSLRRRYAWRILQTGDSFTIPSAGLMSALVYGFKAGTFDTVTPVSLATSSVGSSSKPSIPALTSIPAGSYILLAMVGGVSSSGIFPLTYPYADYPQPPMTQATTNRFAGAGVSNFTWSMASLKDFDGGNEATANFVTANNLTSWSAISLLIKGA